MAGYRMDTNVQYELRVLTQVVTGDNVEKYINTLQDRRRWSGNRPLKVFLSGSFTENAEDFNKYESIIKQLGMEVVRMDKYWEEHPDEVKLIEEMNETEDEQKLVFWRKDIIHLERCDAVVFLPGWIKHRGCCMEYGAAVAHRPYIRIIKL